MLSKSLSETEKIAKQSIAKWQEAKTSGAVVVGLIGDLGAGKTAFTQAVAKSLDVDDHVTSPTFVIEKVYELAKSKPWKHLIHIDAYRLDKAEELLHLGWQELIREPENLILVEWADRVEKILPPSTHKIFFKFVDEQTREINQAS